MTFARKTTLILVLIVLTACSAGPAESAAAPVEPQPAVIAEPTAEPALADPKLYFGIMVHLEGWDDARDEASFREHAKLLREYASIFEEYGAVLTLESKEITEGSIRWGDNVLGEMQERGHGVGVHADVGGQRNYECGQFGRDLADAKAKLESLGVTVRHVSGIVSHCDWVTASLDAGYEYTTGVVAYGLMSMPESSRPAEFAACATPADCHQAYPSELAERLMPWRAASGADWITPITDGGLVIIPSSGALQCMDEEQASTDSFTQCRFTEEDIAVSIAELQEALSLIQPGRVNTYYVSWSFGTPLSPRLLRDWLTAIQPYVESGQVEWASLGEMYDLFVANE